MEALGGGPLAAAVGPGIGPCCYEVGEEVAEPFRARLRRTRSWRDGRLDLWTAAEKALRAAGCEQVERIDLCTSCHPERFFSHRRDEGRTGQAGRRWRISPETVRANYERIRGELGPDVTIVAATKYVAVDDLAALAEAGIEVVGENRAQDLEAKHAATATPSAGTSSATSRAARRRRSTSSASSATRSRASRRRGGSRSRRSSRSTSPARSRSPGIPERDLEDFLGLYEDVRGLMTMPPETGDPEASRPYFRRLRELAERYGLRELSMGTSQDYRVAADEGATMVRLGSVLYRG